MNILPKKRWHVRTKENIARVRRDEAEAAEQAKIEQARIDKAESEARLNFLRTESRKSSNANFSDSIKPEPALKDFSKPSSSSSKHINFFEELEQGNIDYKKTNKDYEKDKKEEQEKYEKQIGLLTYLGQGIKEAVNSSWYNELPKRVKDPEKDIEVKPNRKALEDPMQDIKRYLNILRTQKDTKKQDKKLEKTLLANKVKIEPIIDPNEFKITGADQSDRKRKRKLSIDESSEDDYKTHKKHKKHKSSNNSHVSENRKSHKKHKKRKSSIDDDSSNSHKNRKKRKKQKSSSEDSSEDDHKVHKKHKKKKKHKKQKKHKKDKEIERPISMDRTVDIQKLRAERLERERVERLRAQQLLAEVKAQGDKTGPGAHSVSRQKYNSQFFPELAKQNCEMQPMVKQKYNSQFFPELARQNCD